jgi:cytochrome P450
MTQTPLYHVEEPELVDPFWVLTNYDVIREVARDPETYTVTQGLHLNAAAYNVESTEVPDDPRLVPPPVDPAHIAERSEVGE